VKTVAFIFARGGSKGILKKNIRLFCGKPLIAWSIHHALSVKRIERLIVSTDSEEIASIARAFGAEVPFLRPADLAADESSEWLSWRHGLNYIVETTGSLPEVMVSIPTTAPLRIALDIENCLDEFEKTNADIVITVTEAHRSPYFNMIKTNTDGTVGLVIEPEFLISRRQDVPAVYDMTTVCYVAKPEFVIKYDSIFEGCVRPVYVPTERAIDIDTLLDFQLAEYLLNRREKKI
jgi:CMP-N-acetylneuraminic acid synthetase